jgi:hypothetical protein
MKVWDLRNDRDVPATTFMLSDQIKVSFVLFFDIHFYKIRLILIDLIYFLSFSIILKTRKK